jgi:hypothetical protein
MAEYINIRGQSIEVVASDPANSTVGQIWYNSTSNTLKGTSVTTTGSFSSGSNLSTARRVVGSNGGESVNQALCIGGYVGPTASNGVEEYNGTAWSAGTNIPTGTYGGACCGTQTAALFGLGSDLVSPFLNTSFEYDGATWTAGGSLTVSRVNTNGGAGTQTAGLFFGGGAATKSNSTEEYDGTSWTTSGNLTIARDYPSGAGLQTAALCVAGSPLPTAGITPELYNGATWTSISNLPGTRGEQPGLFGSTTSAVTAGGNNGAYMSSADIYDGTSWAATGSLLAIRGYCGGTGANSSSGIIYAGYNGPSNLNSSEIYTGAGAPTTVTITAS